MTTIMQSNGGGGGSYIFISGGLDFLGGSVSVGLSDYTVSYRLQTQELDKNGWGKSV